MVCAALCTPPAHAGRTDSDWMAPAAHAQLVNAPLVDAPGGLERLDAGPGATRTAIVAEMRIATHAEAQALMQGGGLLGGADAGAGAATATLSALLDRLRTNPPSPTGLTPKVHGTAAAVNAELDCALFAESVRVRRLLGASDAHKPAESAGPASAMWLDVPIRCLAAMPRAESPAPAPQAVPTAANRAATRAADLAPYSADDSTSLLRGPTVAAWLKAHSDWLVMLAAIAVLAGVLGLAALARARDQANGHQWR